MDKTFEPELDLQVDELGVAKELTIGIPNQVNTEDNPQVPHTLQD